MPALTRTPHVVVDGGLETDLIFHRGIELPDFAAFVLLDTPDGRRALREYYEGYVEIARRHGRALRLETPTWRASADWGARLGYDASALDRVNRAAVDLQRDIAGDAEGIPEVQIVGALGPRGDGYLPGSWDALTGARDAETYHRAQIDSLVGAGAHTIAAYTLTDAAEAIGIVRAVRAAGARVEISFTVETDGLLPTGLTLADTLREVEAEAPADGYLLNCAHPDHLAKALDGAPIARIIGIRPNASRLSHAELDESEHLDEGDIDDLARATARLIAQLPEALIVGGCCGTDARHVDRMWQVLRGA